MHRLVGADRNAALDVLQELVVAGGEGLLDQLDAGRCGCSHQKQFGVMRLPGLVGIGDEPRLRHRLAHGGEALRVALAAKLELEQGIGARFARLRRHRLRGAKRKREGREHGTEARRAPQAPRRSGPTASPRGPTRRNRARSAPPRRQQGEAAPVRLRPRASAGAQASMAATTPSTLSP